MGGGAKNIITVNMGSSSLRVAVFDLPGLERIFDIAIGGIGLPVSELHVARHGVAVSVEEIQIATHEAALGLVFQWLAQVVPSSSIAAVGHRLVHSGGRYDGPEAIARISEDDWELFSRLDPIHTPAARMAVGQFTQHYPQAIGVACFDTSFFSQLPTAAKILPIPKKYYNAGVRRYGFHGLAYSSVLSTFREKAGEMAADGRVVMAHLGGGASVAAAYRGKPVDTTMGFTPASGIVMGTRPGNLDPGVFGFLSRKSNMGADEFDHMVNFESGLLGVSGSTGDMYALLQQENHNDDARLAVELFVREVKKTIGAYAALLGGIDSLIFSGGIGGQSALIRQRICQGLGFLGIDIDEAANQASAFLISSAQSGAGVHIIEADEARVMASQTLAVAGGDKYGD